LNLNHTVKLFFTDGEDQGVRPGIYGSKAWAENKTDSELNNISAFIVVDMIGDADLHFTHVWPGSSELWLTISPLARATGLVEGEVDCNGNLGEDVFDIETSTGVIDDHVAAHERGVPAIDLIDIRSGEGAEEWGGYWHTHNDTIDKVSAESLGKIGRLLELGLRSSSWIIENDFTEENKSLVPTESPEDNTNDSVEIYKIAGIISLVIVFCLFTVIFILYYKIKKA
jgi:Zn-dependent M28 family amino/carboxypeptidase